MKKLTSQISLTFAGLITILIMAFPSYAQEDSVVAEEVVKLKYYNKNGLEQYLLVESSLKKGKQSDPLKNKSFKLYLDSIAGENLISSVTTGADGRAKSFIPVSLKSAWDASGMHKFIAVDDKNPDNKTELEIVKSRIRIDTATSDEGVRNITVYVEKYESDSWLPVNEAEMKVGIRRMGGILSAGDDPTYTTDSSGSVSIDVTRDSLPGDAKGNILLGVMIEDNDVLGNVSAEKQVNWGVPQKPGSDFFSQRTLWSTRFRTPFWLLFTAYAIILSVWGTLIYLVWQLIKIRKLGKQSLVQPATS